MKHRRRIAPKIKWSSRKKNSIVLKRRRQRGGFITALVTMGRSALTSMGPVIGQIVAQQLPAIFGGIRGAARGVITEVPTAGPVVVRTLANLAGTGARGLVAAAPRNLASIGVAFAVSAAAAAIGAASVYGPRLIDSLFTSGPAISGSAPAARGVAKISAETARAAGDELGAAVTEAVAVAAAATPPVLTGPLTPAFIKEMKPVDINAYFKANPELKIPEGIDRSLFGIVRNPERVKAQLPAFFKTMVFNGLVEGTPGEILAEAGVILGNTAEATALLAPVVNPAIEAQRIAIAAERAAINAIPEGPAQFDRIAERAAIILRGVALEEAEVLRNMPLDGVPSTRGDLRNMMNYYIRIYQGIFGFHPEQLTGELELTPQEIGDLLGSGGTTQPIADYNVWLPAARTFFENQLRTTRQLAAVRQVMTPQLMSQFRPGLLRVFNHNPDMARTVFYDFAQYVIPYLVTLPDNVRGPILTQLLSNMNHNPGNVRIIMNELLETISRQGITIAASATRTMNNIPARLLFYAIRGAAAATGLFVVTFLGTPNGGGFPNGGGTAGAIRDRVYQWFGMQLPHAPDNTWAGQLAAAAGFQGPDAVQQWGTWIAGQARGWLWNFMGAILAGIGLTAGAAATRLIAYFRGTPDGPPITPDNPLTPPAEGPKLTGAELNTVENDGNSGGGYKRNQRKTRRNR